MKYLSFCLLFLLTLCSSKEEKSVSYPISQEDILAKSIQFIERLKSDQPTEDIADFYASLKLDNLADAIDTEEEKKAFWINTYNAFVQHILTKDPSLFDNRGAFFSAKQINIAGVMMSLDEIEHGIIRANRWKLSWGYFAKPFPPSHVRKLKTKRPDGRVHLALNCGAKSCPEIAIFHAEKVHKELNIIAAKYLKKTTLINGNDVTVTPLMSWFRGDFGNKRGIKQDYLLQYGIIDKTADINISYGDYDWTLSLGNYIELE